MITNTDVVSTGTQIQVRTVQIDMYSYEVQMYGYVQIEMYSYVQVVPVPLLRILPLTSSKKWRSALRQFWRKLRQEQEARSIDRFIKTADTMQ